MDYAKLKDISEFTYQELIKKYWSMWNDAESKYERSDEWKQGYAPKWTIKTDKGILDLSKDQLGQMLVATFDQNKPLNGNTFNVKTNGKNGKDIRYFINPCFAPVGKEEPKTEDVPTIDSETPVTAPNEPQEQPDDPNPWDNNPLYQQ